MSGSRGPALGSFFIAVFLLLNATATLLLARRVKETGDFLVWFALPNAAERRLDLESDVRVAEPLRVEIYYDLTCPLCRESTAALLMMRDEFAGSNLTWALIPVAPAPFVDEVAHDAGLALLCVKRQGVEWALLNEIREVQVADLPSIRPFLTRVGVVEEEFDACLRSRETATALWQNRFDVATLGIQGTPAIVAGGTVIQGAIMEEPLRELLTNMTILSGG